MTSPLDLTAERQVALACAKEWGVELEEPFEHSFVSYVAPTSDGAVLKVPWARDDEALHEADALEMWGGDGAVRLLRRSDRALLEERAMPGDDLSGLAEDVATSSAVDIALRLWRPATAPFRPVAPEVTRWLDRAGSQNHELVPLARELFAEIGGRADWLVHGDFHHHNIVQSGERFVAIDPKPYLSDREYDVAPFLWNPIGTLLADVAQTDRRIEVFTDAGLDEFRIRAWTVIRGSYLRTGPEYLDGLKGLMD
jgi:streptomycin 6-kinase